MQTIKYYYQQIKMCSSISTIGYVRPNMYLLLAMLYTAETKLKLQNAKSYFTLTTIVVRTDMISLDTFFFVNM